MSNSVDITADPTSHNLGKRASSATIWVVFTRVIQQVLGFARVLVLARLLAPEDFGLMGIAMSVLAITQLFTITGFLGALVQRQGDISKGLNTAWTLELARGLLMTAIIVAAAPAISSFTNVPEATPILRVLAAIFILGGLSNVGVVYLRRQLRIRDEMFVNLSGTVAELIVTVTLAIIMESVWALVWGAIARTTTGVLVSYVVYPYMPRLEFNKEEAGKMFRFGRWLSLSAITKQLINQADRFIITKILGPAALGFYTVSDRFSLNPVRELGVVAARVGFPALATLQSDKDLLAKRAASTLNMSLTIIIPVAVAVFILSDSFIPVILGDQWVDAVAITQILVLAAIPMSIVEIGGVPLVAYGIPKIASAAALVALVTVLIAMPIMASNMGLEGAGWAMVIGYSAGTLVILASWYRYLGVGLIALGKVFMPGIAISVAANGPMYLIDNTGLSNLEQTIASSALFIALYAISALVLWKFARLGPFFVLSAARSRAKA